MFHVSGVSRVHYIIVSWLETYYDSHDSENDVKVRLMVCHKGPNFLVSLAQTGSILLNFELSKFLQYNP